MSDNNNKHKGLQPLRRPKVAKNSVHGRTAASGNENDSGSDNDIQLQIKKKRILGAIDTSLSKTKQNKLSEAMSKKRRCEFLELSL